MEIKIEDFLEAIKGYGTDSQPLTIGILKSILIELKLKERKIKMDKYISRAKAQIAFVEGKKISHKYFCDDEYVFLNTNNEMEDENGNILNKSDFWLTKGTKQFDEGWFII